MTKFMNIENYRETRLDGAVNATTTFFNVQTGDGELVLPETPFALTLSTNLSLNYLKQSERVKVIDKVADALRVIRNFDNPSNLLVEGAADGEQVAGAVTLNVTGFVSLVNGNQVIVDGDTTDYVLVSNTLATITIFPALANTIPTGTAITIAVPSSGTGEAQSHASGKPCYLIDCAAYWKEVHTAINTLETDPLPADITGETLTLDNHLQVGEVKSGFDDTAGMIQWAGGHFQGYTGTDWLNLDEQPGGGGWTPPSGSEGQLMVSDGNDWLASSILLLVDDQATLTLGTSEWVFTELLTTIPTEISAPLISAESGSFTGFNTGLTKVGSQIAIGYDADGVLIGSPIGFIAAFTDLDLDSPPYYSYLSPIGIAGSETTIYAFTDLTLMSVGETLINSFTDLYLSAAGDIILGGPTVIGTAFEVTTDAAQINTWALFTPQADYPVAPEDGTLIYHDVDGFRIYQAGAWYSFAAGDITNWPIPGTEYGTVRYNPDIADWEYTDLILIRPEGLYIENALKIGERNPDMLETPGTIEFRNNDFLGYVYDPSGAVIEVSLTSVDRSQRFPIGVDQCTVNGFHPAGSTSIAITGMTQQVTIGEYIGFESDTNLYQIINYSPSSGPTLSIQLGTGVAGDLADGTPCATRYGRTLYFGYDWQYAAGAWHSTDSLRIVTSALELNTMLPRATQLQIGVDGQNGYEGTIQWDDDLKEFRWHNGTQWRYWPVNTELPTATEAGDFLVTEETSPGVFSWVATSSLLIGETLTSDLELVVPALTLTDGVTSVTLLPGDFTFPNITTEDIVADTLTIQGEDTRADIDNLYVKNLFVVGSEDPEEQQSLSGRRLDLIANAPEAYTFSLIPTYAETQSIVFGINIQLVGTVEGNYNAGDKTITIADMTGEVQNGNQIRFAGDPNTYVILSHTGNPTTEIVLVHPGLYQTLTDETLLYTNSTSVSSIFEATNSQLTIDTDLEAHDAQFTGTVEFDHAIKIGLDEVASAGMIRYNGDFQGYTADGNWVSFTRTLADGDYSSGFGTLLWWNGSQWSKNTNMLSTSTGLLKLGTDNSTPGSTGAIRFNGVDFQGYNGATWVSFTGYSGSPTLPSGVGYPGATLRWDDDGTQWLLNTNLTSNGILTEAALLQIGDYARFASTGAINHIGGYNIGDTLLVVDTFTTEVIDGSMILIDGDTTPHEIVAHSPEIGPTTSITIAGPGLAEAVADDASITIIDALEIQTPTGGQIRYNQNDYEGFVENIGWVSFTGHVNMLPTIEGDALLEQGHILVFNGANWVANHYIYVFDNIVNFKQPVCMQSGLDIYGLTHTEGVILGSNIPMGSVLTTGSHGTVVADPAWPPAKEHYDIGETVIRVNQAEWSGAIGVGSAIQIGGGVTSYAVTELSPSNGSPLYITFTPGLVEEILPGYEVQVSGIIKLPIGTKGLVYFNDTDHTFWGHDGTTWVAFSSPIQGSPEADQILRYNADTDYWEPAVANNENLLLVHDDELETILPLRLVDENSLGWRIEARYAAQDETDIYGLIFRNLSSGDIMPEHPVWEDQDIWFEACSGSEEQAGPYFKTYTDYNIFAAVTMTTLTATGDTILGGALDVTGACTLSATLNVSGEVKLDSTLLVTGYIDTLSNITCKALSVSESGYFGTWLRVGYVAGSDAPVGAVRYSTPGNVGRGDWEGWDGEQWVSFTGGFHGQPIWAAGNDGEVVIFDADYDGGKFVPTSNLVITTEMTVALPLICNEGVLLDSNSIDAAAGAIRFTGVDLEGCVDGANWISLTSGSVGGLPNGYTYGSTLYWQRDITTNITTGTVYFDDDHPTGYAAGVTEIFLNINADPADTCITFNNHITVYHCINSVEEDTDIWRAYITPALQKACPTGIGVSVDDYIGSWLPTSLVELSVEKTQINNVLSLAAYEDIPSYNLPAASRGQIRYNQSDYEGYVENVGWVSFTGLKHWADPVLYPGAFMYSNGNGWVGTTFMSYDSGLEMVTLDANMYIPTHLLQCGSILTEYVGNIEQLALIAVDHTEILPLAGDFCYSDIGDLVFYTDKWYKLLKADPSLATEGMVYLNSTAEIETNDSILLGDGTAVPSNKLAITDSYLFDPRIAATAYNGTIPYWHFVANGQTGANKLELYMERGAANNRVLLLDYQNAAATFGSATIPHSIVTYGNLTVRKDSGLGYGNIVAEGYISASGILQSTGKADFFGGMDSHDVARFYSTVQFDDDVTCLAAGIFASTVEFASEVNINDSVYFSNGIQYTFSPIESYSAITNYGYQSVGQCTDNAFRRVGSLRYTGILRDSQVDGDHSETDTIAVKNCTFEIPDGAEIIFAEQATQHFKAYTVVSHTGNPTTEIVLNEAITIDISDGTEIIVGVEGDWEGWDGTYWVSLTNNTAQFEVHGIPADKNLIVYNDAEGYWETTNEATLTALLVEQDSNSVEIDVTSTPIIKINDVQVLTEQQTNVAEGTIHAEATYTGTWDDAKSHLFEDLTTLITKVNDILAILEAHGLMAPPTP